MTTKQIVCQNEDNVQGVFGYDFDPFFILSCKGVTSIYNKVVTSENTMIDGSTYQGSTTKQRNIVLTLQMYCRTRDEAQKNRNFLYKLFKPKATGTFIYQENEETRSIDYKTESIDIDEKGIVRNATISLICPDPFFKAMADIDVDMARWEPLFEFIHEFQFGGEEFGTRTDEIIKEIENDTAASNIGVTITMEAVGAVTDPAMHHIESGEYIKIGTPSNPFHMVMGDILTITTETNNKNVTFTRDGVTRIVNQYLDENSEFIQLQYGMNTLKYDADAGIDYLNVQISYRQRFLGV